MRKITRGVSMLLILGLLLSLFAGSVSALDPASCPFDDIYGCEYESDIVSAYAIGLMNGMSLYKFQPNGNMSRAMFVVTLFRAHRLLTGDEKVYDRPKNWPFVDVPNGTWYSEAIYWAYQKGITNGMDAKHFSPNKALTKEQAATFLYRYEKQNGSHLESRAYLGDCTDAASVSDYARRPMMWLAAIDPETCKNAQVSPKAIPRREELAHMLVNYYRFFTREGDIVSDLSLSETDVRLTILGMEETAALEAGGEYYLPLTAENARRYGIQHQTYLQNDMNLLELTWAGRSLTLTDSFPDAKISGKRVSMQAAPVFLDGVWYLPLGAVFTALGWNVLRDSQNPDGARMLYDKTVNLSAVTKGKKIPVLEYHAVSDNVAGVENDYLYISPLSLRMEIEWLINQGYTFITFEDLDRVNSISKPILLTFDDGYENNYTELFPILKDYNVKATLFVVAKTLNTAGHMSSEQLLEMQESGLVSIQSHTYSHSNMTNLSAADCLWECEASQLEIARITGRIPFVLCYPYGRGNDAVEQQVQKVYQFAVYIQKTPYGYITGNSPYKIYRHEVVRGTTLAKFKSDFNYWLQNMK